MPIIDISPEDEKKAAFYRVQQKTVEHWERFANQINAKTVGEFNLFFIDAKIELEVDNHPIVIKGHRLLTNHYTAEVATAFFPLKRRYEEFTSIEQTSDFGTNDFKITRKGKFSFIKTLFSHFSVNLPGGYCIYSNDNLLIERVKSFWDKASIHYYLDHESKITYNSKDSLLKLKFYRMLDRSNEISNMLRDFGILIDELQGKSARN